MTVILLAYLGGILTIISPCILPVLPFVFARADKPFVRNGLPMLGGMAVAFAFIATLAAVAGGWAVQANEYGRIAAITLLAVFGVMLLFPAISDRLTRPLVALGMRVSRTADQTPNDGGLASSLVLGVATGLLWTPCAGPVLGLILTGAALQGASVRTTLLLLAYALGAATSLALALLAGGRVFAAMKRSFGIGEWVRRGLGTLVLAGVVAIAFGLDTGFLTRMSLARTASLEQGLVNRLQTPAGGPVMSTKGTMARDVQSLGKPADLPVLGTMPSLAGADTWLNSPPLTAERLRGKVVLIDFWTYSCINCLRAIPYVRAWAEKYKDQGLVVIGVHAPEFAFERNVDNVRKAIADLKITYPVAIDNDYAIWRGFDNKYWPAHYVIDARGRIRYEHFGEGEYDKSERVIQQLLADTGVHAAAGLVAVNASGAEVAPDFGDVKSPETYLGYMRGDMFTAPDGTVPDKPHVYAAGALQLNQWGLTGDWTIGGDQATLNAKDGSISYRFHARDLHLVLGPAPGAGPVHFRVTIDGAAPGNSHGANVDADGQGVVDQQRLYQLVRQTGPIVDRTFEIHFLEPGVQAFAFTFG